MSGTGVLWIVFVIVLSGALAYWGDVIGRRLGKKRLTIGRLRPRHTAAIMTALFGMLGALAAILILMAVAEPVRKMLLEGDQLFRLNSELRAQNRKAQDLLAAQNRKLEESNQQIASTKGQLAGEKAKLLLAQKDVAGLKKLADSLTTQAKAVRKQLAAAETRLRNQTQLIEAAQKRLADIEKEKKSAQSSVAEASKQLEQFSKQNLELDQKLQDNRRERDRLAGEITRLNTDISGLQAQLDKQTREAGKELAEVRRKVEEAQGEVESAKADLNRLTTNIQRFLEGPNMIPRTMPTVFMRGDEITRQSVGPNLTAAEARNYVLALLQDSSRLAAARGAKPAAGQTLSVAWPVARDNLERPVPDDVQMNDVVSKTAGKKQDLVLVSRVFFNAFSGEPVQTIVEVRPNPVIYREGSLVAEGRIEGQLSEDLILASISKFVQEKLAPKAVKDGMIPAVGHTEPLGEIPLATIWSLVNQIRATNRTVRVQFLATSDTRAGDHLKLEFRIR